MKRLSVVVVNYNYEQYVGAAIESALALDWDDVEVVVVDDGSTDGSPEVIESYSDRVKVCLTQNSTQRVAAARGFAMTDGDVVVFLDSDDVLPPRLPRALASVWTPTTSKVQFQMRRLDASGTPIGKPFPAYRRVPTPADIRRWASRTSAYPTPPGSGNAYARWYLDRIMPLDPSIGDFADSGCLAAAPFLGDVVTAPGILVGYRQHGENDSNLLKDNTRFAREVVRARARWRFAQRVSGVAEADIDERPLFRSRELLQFRVASRAVAPTARPLPDDGWLRLLRDTLAAPFHPGPETLGHRLMILAWCIGMLLAPERLVRRLLVARYGAPR